MLSKPVNHYRSSQANSDSVSVLFVCMGNICRSPTAEGVFHHYVAEAGYGDVVHIDSAGIIDYHTGQPADQRMRQAASLRGYSLDSIARQVKAADIEKFSLLVAMDTNNLQDLQQLAGGDKPHIRMLGSFLDDVRDNATARSVPDPYYGGSAGFDEVLDMIEAACPAILEHCLWLLNENPK